jgi:signal transduction histidine kinase/ligand-binding sensor domain-containing protein/DNA-binding response OmpR family regulator
LLALVPIVSFSQESTSKFNKVSIELDGEAVFDVSVITQDHQGYMWLETNLGLIKYDGFNAKKYDLRKPPNNSFSDDYIRVLLVDSQGILWVGANSGLSLYQQECDCLTHFPELINNHSLMQIIAITEDKAKNIWIGTSNGSLFKYDRSQEEFTRMLYKTSYTEQIIKDRIDKLLVDKNNNLWIGTDSGLIRYNINNESVDSFVHDPSNKNSITDNRITAVYEDQTGQILIGTAKSGLNIYNSDNNSFTRINSKESNPNELYAPYSEESVFGEDPQVNLLLQDKLGDYWIGTTGKGINHFKTRTKTINFYDFSLINPQVLWAIYEDDQGNVWFGGTMGAGLYKTDIYAGEYFVNRSFTNVETAYESSINPDILWVNTQENGLYKLNIKTNESINYQHNPNNSKSIGHKWTRAVYQENENTLWIGLGNGGAYGGHDGHGGIDKMNIATGEFTHFRLTREDDERGDFSYTVYSIVEDKEGYLWLGAGPGGVFRSNKDKTNFEPFLIEGVSNTTENVYLNLVRGDSNGNIWVSDFAGDGTLYLFDRDENMFKPFTKGFKMSNLLIDDNGKYLISTWEQGLIHLNPADKTFIQYTKEDGLPSHNGLDIAKGDSNTVWVSTRIGPTMFDTNSGTFTNVGLPKQRYNFRILKASNNQLYVGAGDGLYSFYSDQFLKNPYAPKLAISKLTVSEREYLFGSQNSESHNFKHSQNDISINYIALHFSNAKKNTFQYKLKPLNESWVDVGKERTARFFNLSPGSYSFQLKAANSDGVWSNETQMLKFTISSPWWTTWWAYLVYFILFGFVVYSIYRFQLSRKLATSETKRLREVNQFKNSLFTNITHEFRTPLTVIKGMTDTIKSSLEKKELDHLDSSLEMIERNSDGLLQLVNEMLDLAKIESGNMELQLVQTDVVPFIKYVCESFESYAEENHIKLTTYSEVDSLVMDFDNNKLTSVLSNLLSNAIKFTLESGKIIVHINQITQNDRPYLFIKVKDSGIGIAENELSNIFSRFYQTDASTVREQEGTGIGLALTKELIDLMQGTINVKSTIGAGSEFSVTIPITNSATKIDKVEIGKRPQITKLKTASTQINDFTETDSELPLVLIIEDNMDVAHYLRSCLKDKFETLHAPNGIKGIELALEHIPDIIISDVMMPGKDGFEVCETLKTEERTDHIPIVILTAKASFEDKLKGLSHGADAYLAKPFIKEELFIRLDKLVANRKKLINKIQKEGSGILLKKQTKNPKLQFLQKVIKLIHEDISNSEFGSEELAKKLLVSESQVYRKIKAITGKSTAVYLRSIRLQYAKELLITSNKTVSEVAFDAGFNDPSWFSRAFKKEFGYSPTAASK